jgi:hypothetical protein
MASKSPSELPTPGRGIEALLHHGNGVAIGRKTRQTGPNIFNGPQEGYDELW